MLKQQTIDSLFVATQQRLYNYALHLHFKDTFLSDPYFFSSAFCEQPKPSHSYIGLIAMAILSSPESSRISINGYQIIIPIFERVDPVGEIRFDIICH